MILPNHYPNIFSQYPNIFFKIINLVIELLRLIILFIISSCLILSEDPLYFSFNK
jgi:hypothetical protein